MLKEKKLHDAACGLAYLHSQDIIHSNLKGVCLFLKLDDRTDSKYDNTQENVLITPDKRVILSDYGVLCLLVDNAALTEECSLLGSRRWMAPEQIQSISPPTRLSFTKATDIWAFGMVIYVR